jgi:hypothetical protein
MHLAYPGYISHLAYPGYISHLAYPGYNINLYVERNICAWHIPDITLIYIYREIYAPGISWV